MLIYEISRHINNNITWDHTLSCTFPSGTGFVAVKSNDGGQSTVLKFKLDPDTPIEVPVVRDET